MSREVGQAGDRWPASNGGRNGLKIRQPLSAGREDGSLFIHRTLPRRSMTFFAASEREVDQLRGFHEVLPKQFASGTVSQSRRLQISSAPTPGVRA